MTEDSKPDHESLIENDTLVVEDGIVTGSIISKVKDGYHVEANVSSYETGDFCPFETNHELRVVVLDTNSHVVTQVCTNGSVNPDVAIVNARLAVRHAYYQLDEGIEK